MVSGNSQIEEWRACPGFEGWYEVSNQGRVRRLAACRGTSPGRILRPSVSTGGYLKVNLAVDGRHFNREIHCLVALAFLGPRPFPGAQVNHKDGDKTNPRLSNLEFVSQSQNIRHALATGLLQPHFDRHCSRCGAFGHYVTGCFDVEALADEIHDLETA